MTHRLRARSRPAAPAARRTLALLAVAGALWFLPVGAAARATRIGFVLDGPWDRNAAVVTLVQQEIAELAGGPSAVEFPPAAVIEADWTPTGVSAALDRLLADDDIDVVIALGVLSSDRACRRGALPRPVVAPIVVDPAAQALPGSKAGSGVRNLAYLTVPATVERDIHAFRDLVPFDRLTILLNRYVSESMPGLAAYTRTLAAVPGLSVTVVPVRGSAGEALAAVPEDAQAVYVMPLLQISASSFDSLVSGLNARRLPTFSALGEREVERGLLAGVSPDIFPRLARRTAVTVQRILAGEAPERLPTGFAVGERLTINMQTARSIGFQPIWADLAEANVVADERELVGRRLTLNEAMSEAVAENRDLAAAERVVTAGAQTVRQARAGLLPQADAATGWTLIDEDRAAASFGTQAERTVTASLSVTQVVYSEPTSARVAVETAAQRARERERDQTRLDTARSAGAAYIRVLRALTFERIQRQNLELTREHLELARLRQTVGSARLSDVYRWESEIATNRKATIDANAERNVAEMELNRLLHRPAEQPFQPAELTLDSPDVAAFLTPCLPYLDDKTSLRTLRNFLVDEALRTTPELARLDATRDAAERSLKSASRAFYLPSLGLSGSLQHLVDEGGAGAGGASIPGLPAGTLTEPDDLDWSIGLRLSFPLFRGGEKLATRARSREELSQVELQREAAAERVEQRTRAAVHNAGASYAGIRESQSAAEWAKRSLELVSEAYARGAVSFIDLLDAQNAHIVADQAAADAVYGFLDDLLEVQRAVGRFGHDMSAEERAAFSDRLRTFALRGTQTEEK